MSTGISGFAAARVGAALALTAALVCAGTAHADPSQDDRFLNLLREEQIPPVDNFPALVHRAHEICGEFDGGTPFRAIMDEEMNAAYADNPMLHLYPGRLARTAARFITASVDVYCPRHLGDLG